MQRYTNWKSFSDQFNGYSSNNRMKLLNKILRRKNSHTHVCLALQFYSICVMCVCVCAHFIIFICVTQFVLLCPFFYSNLKIVIYNLGLSTRHSLNVNINRLTFDVCMQCMHLINILYSIWYVLNWLESLLLLFVILSLVSDHMRFLYFTLVTLVLFLFL